MYQTNSLTKRTNLSFNMDAANARNGLLLLLLLKEVGHLNERVDYISKILEVQ